MILYLIPFLLFLSGLGLLKWKWSEITPCVSRIVTCTDLCKNFLIYKAESLFPKDGTVKVERNRHGKNYNIQFGDERYTIFVPRGKLNCPPLKITNEKGEDITELLSPYLGPNNDFFFSTRVTPEILGQKNITIFKDDENIMTFEANEVLF